VNDAFGRKYFPHENPIGKRVKVSGGRNSDPPWLTIVGVAGDEKRQDFFRPMSWEEPPMVFRPVLQEPPARAFMIVHADGGGAALAATIQRQIRARENNVVVSTFEPLEKRLSRTLSYPEFRAVILTAFALLAVFLAAIGLYAVLAQLIAQR